MDNRSIPALPPHSQQLRLVIDSDTGAEIDDLYAIALAVRSPERFRIEGFVATHFAQMAGRESIQKSYDAILTVLDVAGVAGAWTVVKGGEFHFHDIIIPENVTLAAHGQNPLVLTATGRVEIAGTIDISGQDGTDDVNYNSGFIPVPGGKGGPGGGNGGMGQPPVPKNFGSLTALISPPFGERGWGPGNLQQTGGLGGESGAKGTDVSWAASSPDGKSRGARGC